MQLSEQEVVRREKLAKLRELGINPYPANLYPLDSDSKQIKDEFKEGKKVEIRKGIPMMVLQIPNCAIANVMQT